MLRKVLAALGVLIFGCNTVSGGSPQAGVSSGTGRAGGATASSATASAGGAAAGGVSAGAGGVSSPVAPAYAPYKTTYANFIYNLLFCDDPSLFKPKPGEKPVDVQTTLFSEPVDIPALQALANDAASEGRHRYLAYARLRALKHEVTPKVLLGVIVEYPLNGGLDTIAAFSDGGVRYINYTGKMAVFEGTKELDPFVKSLFAASAPAVAHHGPWEAPRKPPPGAGDVRITFLVSDGLYFGEGPMSDMDREASAGPILYSAARLLQKAVGMGVR
jgi:hypothetical protein